MKSILEKRLTNFYSEIDVLRIHEYLNVDNAKIQMIDPNTVDFCFEYFVNTDKIHFIKQTMVNKLPKDILRKIQSYIPIHLYIHISFHVDYPLEYPFRPPTWSINMVETNLLDKPTIETRCQELIKKHNSKYMTVWSPAIQLFTDILSVYIHYNQFDTFIQEYIF
jgi:hypothetical protein